jgi:hypothetical protein
MKKLNPFFVNILIDILTRVLQAQAMEQADRAQVRGLLDKLAGNSDIVDRDGDGIPDAVDGDIKPPLGLVSFEGRMVSRGELFDILSREFKTEDTQSYE